MSTSRRAGGDGDKLVLLHVGGISFTMSAAAKFAMSAQVFVARQCVVMHVGGNPFFWRAAACFETSARGVPWFLSCRCFCRLPTQ